MAAGRVRYWKGQHMIAVSPRVIQDFLGNESARSALQVDSQGFSPAWLPHDWFERLEANKNRKRFCTKLVSIFVQFWVPWWIRFSLKIIIFAILSAYRFDTAFLCVFGSIFQSFLHVFLMHFWTCVPLLLQLSYFSQMYVLPR